MREVSILAFGLTCAPAKRTSKQTHRQMLTSWGSFSVRANNIFVQDRSSQHFFFGGGGGRGDIHSFIPNGAEYVPVDSLLPASYFHSDNLSLLNFADLSHIRENLPSEVQSRAKVRGWMSDEQARAQLQGDIHGTFFLHSTRKALHLQSSCQIVCLRAPRD